MTSSWQQRAEEDLIGTVLCVTEQRAVAAEQRAATVERTIESDNDLNILDYLFKASMNCHAL